VLRLGCATAALQLLPDVLPDTVLVLDLAWWRGIIAARAIPAGVRHVRLPFHYVHRKHELQLSPSTVVTF
jgi:hypothetical protein